MPSTNWTPQRPPALVQSTVKAEIADQMNAATGKKTEGRTRVINILDGSWASMYPTVKTATAVYKVSTTHHSSPLSQNIPDNLPPQD
jgi:hypothetical protein